MENRLLENRLFVENGHSRNRQFAGVATALILLGVAVVCVVTYKVGPHDGVEMLSKGEEQYMRAFYETTSCPAKTRNDNLSRTHVCCSQIIVEQRRW